MPDSQEKKYFKTSDLVKMSGLTRQMIYEYISLGLLEEVKRTKAGHRLFDKQAVTQAKLIRKLSRSGYTLRAIREIFVEGKGRSGKERTDEKPVP